MTDASSHPRYGRRRVVLVALAAAATAAAWHAVGEARAVRAALTSARSLVSRASSGEIGLAERLELLDRAATLTQDADDRTRRFPLGVLGEIPFLGRDIRVTRAIARTADTSVRAARGALASVARVERGTQDAVVIQDASRALRHLRDALDEGIRDVEAATPVLATRRSRSEFLAEATAARGKAAAASTVLDLAARLYGPAGSTRYFLAFQNPAELRGTGGLIGQYGIVESAPQGPRLSEVQQITVLEGRATRRVSLPADQARRYARFSPNQVWTSVNISPDMPRVGRTLLDLYEAATGKRLDGVVAIDPAMASGVLEASGPISAEGTPLDASTLVRFTTVDAYTRFATDNARRVRLLATVARKTFDGLIHAFRTDPAKLARSLAIAARGRHLMIYSDDPGMQRALERLGAAGEASAPPSGDYLMPVGVNTGGNKLDAFLHRTVRYVVRLAEDGTANVNASITLRNEAQVARLPEYVAGPHDARFRAGDNWQFQTLYVADGYEFTGARLDDRLVGAEAQRDLGALALSRELVVPAGRSITLAYDLYRRSAASAESRNMVYRLFVRPQSTINTDVLHVAVSAPSGWRFVEVPNGFVGTTTLTRTAPLTRNEAFRFVLTPATSEQRRES